MEISRKTDYAVRMLAELVRSDGNIVSVRHVAAENGVPYSFARSIQHELVKAGLVESIRGSRGGMRLAIDPTKTTLRDIVEAVQGPIVDKAPVAEKRDDQDFNEAEAGFGFIWQGAERLVSDYLESVTLYQVVIERRSPALRDDCEFVALTDEERAAIAGRP